jgi:hypothetical protein
MIPGVVDQQIDDIEPVVGDTTFIAVGHNDGQDSPVVMTSVNGSAWNSSTAAAISAFPTALLFGVASDGTRWVAVGVDSNDLTTPVIITSDDDGATWIARTPDPATNALLNGVAWTGTTFIAVGSNGSTNPIAMTSADGATWTARTSDPTTAVNWHGVSGISGLAIACGWSGSTTPRIMSSADDGATWTARTAAPTTQQQLNGVVCEAARAVIVGLPTSGTTTPIQSSSNGTTWAAETGAPSTGVDLYAVCHNGTLFVAVGTDHALQEDPKIMTSPDGDTWTARTPDPSSGGAGSINLVGVAASTGGTVVAVGRDQGFNESFIMSSANGTTWIERDPVPSVGTVLNAVAGLGAVPAGDLAGAVALTFTPTADLDIESGALSGITSITFTPSGSMAFRPTDLGAALSLWYDASDSGSITQTGGLVDQLNDKSGNANHLTASSTARPATGANTLNGLNVLTYAGTNDVLARTASVTVSALHQTGATMVVVRKYSASGNQGVFWTSTQSGSFGDNCVMGREGTNSGIWGNAAASSAGLPAAVSDTDNTNFHIQSGAFVSSKSREIFTDGTSSATNTGNASSLTSPVTSIFLGQCLSASRGVNMFLTGQIAEAILLAGSGATNRQLIEGYVAHKWGLAGNLPVGHPYKTNPP